MPEPTSADNPRRTAPDPTPSALSAAATRTAEQTADRADTRDDFRTLLAPAQGPGELGRLAHYRVVKWLGRGGMGLVFQAVDTQLERPVALKIMRPQYSADPAARERFLREAKAAAAIRHDHIVTIYQVGEDRGTPFIAMEFLHGASLDRWLGRGRPLTVPQAVRLTRETAAGLAAAHAHGLVHRDIKPGNLWLEAPHGRVKILDFGLARSAKDDVHLTVSGVIVGTPAYMAPEQARCLAVDHRCDLFSLGCVLYRLCTGRLPFPGDSAMAVLTALAVDDPPPVRALNPDVPPALAELIGRLMAKRPEDRPASAEEVALALRAIERARAGGLGADVPVATPVEDAPAAEPPDVWQQLQEPTPRPAAPARPPAAPRRRWPPVAALGGGLAALVLVGGLIVHSLSRDGASNVTKPPGDGPGRAEPDGAAVARAERAPPPDPAWVARVRGLPPAEQVTEVAEELRRRNPGFDGRVIPEFTNVAVRGLKVTTDRVSDLRPAAALEGLTDLYATGSRPNLGHFGDLEQLRGCERLSRLYLDNNPNVKDLAPLRGRKLVELSAAWTGVSDLAPLSGMPLKSLDIEMTAVRDLAPLRGLPLNRLRCRRTEVADPAVLRGLPLTELACDIVPARDTGLLRSFPALKTVNDEPVAEFWKAISARADGDMPPGAIDLLPLIDPAKDVVKGIWERRGKELAVSGDGAAAVLEMPYRPPDEYDYIVEFTRTQGNEGVSLALSRAGRSFRWCLGESGNRYGFDVTGGRPIAGDPAAVQPSGGLATGKRHRALVRVRRDGLTGLLDGKTVNELKTDYANLSMAEAARLRDPALLGLGLSGGAAKIHRAAVLEVSGLGQFTRPGDAAAKAARQQ
jgi:predicted Ser/Thr protein kinase